MVFTHYLTTVCRTEDIWAARWMSLSFIEWLTTLNDHGARFRRNTHEIDHTALNENTSRKFPCHVHICVKYLCEKEIKLKEWRILLGYFAIFTRVSYQVFIIAIYINKKYSFIKQNLLY